MAVANLLRTTIHWSGYGEEGTLNLAFSGVPAADGDKLNQWCSSLNDIFGSDTDPTLWQQLTALLTPQQRFDYISAYQYATGSGAATSQGIHSVNHQGTDSSIFAGLQQAICITTDTGMPGRSNRGRMYWPAHCLGVTGANAQLPNVTVDAIGATAAQFVSTGQDQARAEFDADGIRAVVFSRARSSARPITSITVDGRVDTQRRRATNQVPAYSNTFNTAVD